MTDPETETQEAIAERIFARYHDDQWPLRRIADQVGGMSGETVRKILIGDTWQDVTEELRARYPAYVQRGSELFDDVTIAGVFADYHDEERSLSEIARGLDVSYTYVRKILTGAAEYDEPTKELRSRYPTYAPRTGRGSRGRGTRGRGKCDHRRGGGRAPLDTPTLTNVFKLYFVNRLSLDEVGHVIGVRPEFVSDLVTGQVNPEVTAHLRAQYGDTIRPRRVLEPDGDET